jgi:hypothetical protein
VPGGQAASDYSCEYSECLERLPKTLDETYTHTLLDIDEENREYAQELF